MLELGFKQFDTFSKLLMGPLRVVLRLPHSSRAVLPGRRTKCAHGSQKLVSRERREMEKSDRNGAVSSPEHDHHILVGCMAWEEQRPGKVLRCMELNSFKSLGIMVIYIDSQFRMLYGCLHLALQAIVHLPQILWPWCMAT